MLVLDAGAFVAVERGGRVVVALIKRERLAGRPPVTSGGVVAQVWRGGRGLMKDNLKPGWLVRALNKVF